MPWAAGNQRCRARLHNIVVGYCLDIAIRPSSPRGLLNRGVVERDQRERASRADRAKATVAFAGADHLGVSVDLGERAVIGMAGVSDGIRAAVSRRVAAVLAPRVAPRPEWIDLPVQAEDDQAPNEVKAKSRCRKVAWGRGEPVDLGRVGRQDPCAFAPATSLMTYSCWPAASQSAGVVPSSAAVDAINRCSPRVVSLAS
jgi:hypothetical protein